MEKLPERVSNLQYHGIMINAILVDDELHCLKALKMLLNEHCKHVGVLDECRSAHEALESINKFKPDLVFLDIEMPVMNGFDAAAA